MPSLVWDHKDTELLPGVPYIPMDRDIAGLHRKLDEAPEKADRRLEDIIRSTTDVATVTTREEVKKKYAELLKRMRKLDRSPTFNEAATISETNIWHHRIPLAIQKVADRLEGTPAEEVRASTIHDL